MLAYRARDLGERDVAGNGAHEAAPRLPAGWIAIAQAGPAGISGRANESRDLLERMASFALGEPGIIDRRPVRPFPHDSPNRSLSAPMPLPPPFPPPAVPPVQRPAGPP